MNLPQQIAKHFRDVHFGGNWTASHLRQHVAGLTWQQAIQKHGPLNSIAALVFHMNYYVSVMLKVLQGGPLDAHDKFSFDLPAIQWQDDWEKLLDKTWREAEAFASLVEQLPESRLDEAFAGEKYGTYYRNLHGVIEHCHYHLGQIVIIRKLVDDNR
jgi:uncharacterized damage-inducible protein DinB